MYKIKAVFTDYKCTRIIKKRTERLECPRTYLEYLKDNEERPGG